MLLHVLLSDTYFSIIITLLARGGGHDLTRVRLESHISGLETCLTNIDKRLDLTLTWYSSLET